MQKLASIIIADFNGKVSARNERKKMAKSIEVQTYQSKCLLELALH
jgi:hypothetical protein